MLGSRGQIVLPIAAACVVLGAAQHADAQTAAASGPANAQPAAPTSAAASQLSEVVVTGSRISNASISSPTPLTVFGRAQIEQTAPSTVDDVLNEIPQLKPDSGPTQIQRNTGALTLGQSLPDLRGLGAQRTLLLIDGQRPVPTNENGTASTSIVPVGLVERVDVVTGGASAAYGSDAVAGVVNIVLNDHLEGLRGSVFGGMSQEGDNAEKGLDLAGGFSRMGGRLHVVGGIDYDDNRGVGNIFSRDWSALQYGNSGFPMTAPGNRPAGMPANFWAQGVEYATQTPGGFINSATTSTGAPTKVLNGLAFSPNGSTYLLPRGPIYGNLMTDSTSNPVAGPMAQWNLQVPLKQAASLARATFDVSDSEQVFLQASYAWSNAFSFSQYHQTPNDIVLASNPYLPASVQSLMLADGISQFNMGRVDTEWLGTSGDDTSRTAQIMTGIKGKIGRFRWDTSYTYGRSQLDSKIYGTRQANLAAAEYPVLDASGNIVCGPLSTNPNFGPKYLSGTVQPSLVQPGCVPVDPFGAGNISRAAINYVSGWEYTSDVMVRHDAAANISGRLFDMPAGAVQGATGVEYRYDSLAQSTDALQQLGLYSVGNLKPFSGNQSVAEGYAEVDLPLLKDLPLVKSLGLNAAARYAHYRTSGGATTWKLGAVWKPVESLLFRVTKSRDIRAPDLYSLYNSGGFALQGSYTNPFNGQSARLPQTTTGNPDLKPEVGNTLTLGATFHASEGPLSGFGLSVDYYSIKIRDVIASVAATTSLQNCYEGLKAYCSAITFDNSTFGIADVLSEPFNQSLLDAKGIDIQADYRHDLAPLGLPGAIAVALYATNVERLATTIAPGSPSINYAGYAGIGQGAPKWVLNALVDYRLKRVTAGVQVHGFTAVGYSPNYVGPGQPGYDPASSSSISQNSTAGLAYVNLNGAYDLGHGGNYQLFFHIDNLLNRDPPPYAIAMFNLGGNPYDYIGRTFKLGVRFDFF